MHGRLADGLAIADREGRVLIRAVLDAARHEQVSRSQVEGPQEGEVVNPLAPKVLQKARARAAKLSAYGARHHRTASSRRAVWVKSRCSGVTEMNPSRTARMSVPTSDSQVTDPPPIQ